MLKRAAGWALAAAVGAGAWAAAPAKPSGGNAASKAYQSALDGLQSPYPGKRRHAVDALAELKDPRAVTPLVDMCHDPHPLVRQAVLLALRDLSAPEGYPVIVRGMVDPDEVVSDEANTIVMGLGSAIVPALIDGLKESEIPLRRKCSFFLAKIPDERAAVPLSRALADADPIVRQQAAVGLGHAKDPAILPSLIAAAKDPVVSVRQGVMMALGNFSHPQSLTALVAGFGDENSGVRQQAALSVGRFRSAAAVAALTDQLGHPDLWLRKRVIEVLEQYGGHALIFATALGHSAEAVRAEAAAYLTRVNHPAVNDALVLILRNAPAETRVLAINILAARGARSALPALRAALQDRDPGVADAAKRALEMLGETVPGNFEERRP